MGNSAFYEKNSRNALKTVKKIMKTTYLKIIRDYYQNTSNFPIVDNVQLLLIIGGLILCLLY